MKKNLFLLTGLLGLSAAVHAQMGNFSDAVRLGPNINTDNEESMPVLSKDKSVLYFTRTFQTVIEKGKKKGFTVYNQDIWYSDVEGTDYVNAKKMEANNTKENNGVVAINKEGDVLYILDSYIGNKFDTIKGCAKTVKKGSSWGTPAHMDIPSLDINGPFYGFHVDENETVMIISYPGPGTLGEEDLYISLKNGESWGEPVHMGSVINTSGFEISPYLSASMDTLYFSSNGLGGEGDADIFYSIKQNGSWTDWSTPVNLGSKINSPRFDAFFTFIRNSDRVYWASNRDGDKSDIYYATILPPPPLTAIASGTDVTVYQGSDGKIDMTPEGGVPPYEIIWSNNSTLEDPQGLVKGVYTAQITDAIGQNVEVSVMINEPNPPKPPVVDLAALLKDVKPIYFDLGKYNIRKDASKELDKIVKIMNEHPDLEIELGSHTDCQASFEYNMVLSDHRAKASAAYIQQRITKPERITGKGYGESQLKEDCPCEGDVKSKCTEKQHQLNRRTEFKLRDENSPSPDVVVNPTNPEKKTDGSSDNTTGKPKGNGTIPGSKFRTDIPVTEDQKANMANGFYIVQEGETLYRVSVNSKVSTDQLRKLNDLKNNNIKPGTKLLIR